MLKATTVRGSVIHDVLTGDRHARQSFGGISMCGRIGAFLKAGRRRLRRCKKCARR
jgi:hypothetical protein